MTDQAVPHAAISIARIVSVLDRHGISTLRDAAWKILVAEVGEGGAVALLDVIGGSVK